MVTRIGPWGPCTTTKVLVGLLLLAGRDVTPSMSSSSSSITSGSVKTNDKVVIMIKEVIRPTVVSHNWDRQDELFHFLFVKIIKF